MYKDMDDKLKDLKFFLLHHYKSDTTKEDLVSMLILLEDEKIAIVKKYCDEDIQNLKKVQIKNYLMQYIEDITKDIDKNRLINQSEQLKL